MSFITCPSFPVETLDPANAGRLSCLPGALLHALDSQQTCVTEAGVPWHYIPTEPPLQPVAICRPDLSQPHHPDLSHSQMDGFSLLLWPSDTRLRRWKGRYNLGPGPSKFFRLWGWERERYHEVIPLGWREMTQDPELKRTRWKVVWWPSWPFYISKGKVNQWKQHCSPKINTEFWYVHDFNMYMVSIFLSPLESHPKPHSIFGKTRRRNSKIFVGVTKSNQVHSEAAWKKLERSQAAISMQELSYGGLRKY